MLGEPDGREAEVTGVGGWLHAGMIEKNWVSLVCVVRGKFCGCGKIGDSRWVEAATKLNQYILFIDHSREGRKGTKG